jgi:Domain of unknown function (DUF4326)
MTETPRPPGPPRVWNKRDPCVPPGAVYVGRPSRYGNPFHLRNKHDRAEREAVIRRYRDYLLHENEGLLALVRAHLRGKHLVCWCAPLPCHADVLLVIANQESR